MSKSILDQEGIPESRRLLGRVSSSGLSPIFHATSKQENRGLGLPKNAVREDEPGVFIYLFI